MEGSLLVEVEEPVSRRQNSRLWLILFGLTNLVCPGSSPLHFSQIWAKGTSVCPYRVTLCIRTPPPVGPYSSSMPRDIW